MFIATAEGYLHLLIAGGGYLARCCLWRPDLQLKWCCCGDGVDWDSKDMLGLLNLDVRGDVHAGQQNAVILQLDGHRIGGDAAGGGAPDADAVHIALEALGREVHRQ